QPSPAGGGGSKRCDAPSLQRLPDAPISTSLWPPSSREPPMRLTPPIASLALCLALAQPPSAQTAQTPQAGQPASIDAPTAAERKEQGNRVPADSPATPAEPADPLNRHQH